MLTTIGFKILGEGPLDTGLMIVGDSPDYQDSENRKIFSGAVGAELNRYLRRQAGLNREAFYLTNIIKWRADEENDNPREEEIKRDEPELIAEIALIQPTLIVAVGKIAAEYFLGHDVDMDKMSGLPHHSTRFNTTIFIVISPASGMYLADRFAPLIARDFTNLGKFLRGEFVRAEDEYKGSENYSLTVGTPDLVAVALNPGMLGIDTEGWVNDPWGFSTSAAAGQGFVFKGNCIVGTGRFVFHYALHDLPVLRAMGITIPEDKIEDTLIMAYLLGNEPKRLKALAYRHCGMEMDEYEDIVEEPEKEIVKEYYQQILSKECQECKGRGEVQIPWKRQPKCKDCLPPKKVKRSRPRAGLELVGGGAEEVSGTTGGTLSCSSCSGTGFQPKFKSIKCPSCNGDGTSWPLPELQLIIEDDGEVREYKPQSVGRRIRRFVERESYRRKSWEVFHDCIRSPIEAILGQLPRVTLDDVKDQERVIAYSCRDADSSLRVYHKLKPKIKQMGLERAYEIDKSIIGIIDRMQSNGILLDIDHFTRLGIDFEKQKTEKKDKLAELVGYRFNPSSSKQVGELLYTRLGLDAPKKTKKGGDSTNEKALQMLKIKHADNPELAPIIDGILDVRELDKMLGTYIYPLPKKVDKNGRLHTSFSLTRTSTGRLASSSPNLQNIPTRSELGRSIRTAFIAASGKTLLSVDLDQIELRVCAHLSNELNMIEVFQSGKDIHRSTAARMFGIPFEGVSSDQRRAAKTINFGVLYGMSATRLMNELAIEGIKISRKQAQEFIKLWFRSYPGVQNYMDRCHAEARKNGFVRTLFGHIRYLPNVHSFLPEISEEALRQAGNAPTQGTAAEIMKMGMAGIWKRLPEIQRYGYCEPLLTIHDEVILEVDESIAEVVKPIIEYEMSNAVELLVPLGSKGVIAKRWSELKG